MRSIQLIKIKKNDQYVYSMKVNICLYIIFDIFAHNELHNASTWYRTWITLTVLNLLTGARTNRGVLCITSPTSGLNSTFTTWCSTCCVRAPWSPAVSLKINNDFYILVVYIAFITVLMKTVPGDIRLMGGLWIKNVCRCIFVWVFNDSLFV